MILNLRWALVPYKIRGGIMKRSIFLVLFIIQLGYSQTLRDPSNHYDYVIITIPEFVDACEPFKNHKESNRNFEVLVTDIFAITGEFNSAETLQENIREFISYAGTFWKEPTPKYFLIAGDLTKVPNFFEENVDTASTDFYYSQSIHTADTINMEFYIGRVPATSILELNNYFNKVITYESNQSINDWDNKSLFVSVRDDSNYFHFDTLTDSLSQNLPAFIKNEFIFSNPASPYYGSAEDIIDFFNNNGSSSAWFIGQSYRRNIGENNFFTLEDVDKLSNANSFFAFILGCQLFADDSIRSVTDKLILHEYGAIAAISSVGAIFYFIIRDMFHYYTKNLYADDSKSAGELLAGYGGFVSSLGYHGYKIVNLWGDPSLQLKYGAATNIAENSLQESKSYSLDQNYPNPFNPVTTINFVLPETGHISLKVYNVLGNEVASLINEVYPAGNHKINFDGALLSSGIYFYTMSGQGFNSTKKMILMK
jgi:hypothetical protein